MLDALRFVQGAVAKKDFVAALTHYQIKNGFVKGHNGGLTLCSPIDLDIDVTPKAVTFAKAIATCKSVIQMHLTPSNRLSIKSGNFRALVDCIEEGFPHTDPEGDSIDLPNGGILKALKTLAPFIAEDASRGWARGILFRGQSAFSTNNVVLLEYWLGYEFPAEINVPRSAVMEMIRIGVDPIRMMVANNSVTFFYPEGKWLKTQLYSLEWPDLGKVLGKTNHPLLPPEGLWDALESAEPFVNKLRQVWLKNGTVSTDSGQDAGATIDVPGIEGDLGIYNVDYLLELSEVVQAIDLTMYPNPCIFYGENIRGAIVGMRG